jgi:(S)-2-hydroxyglutarate dehydrogenase
MTADLRCDVAVVGGGIVGLATAWQLALRGLGVTVLEAEDQLGRHQTGHNSGVIHSGLYYRPGSLKALLCTEGREALYRLCAEEGIAHRRCGKLVVAVDDSELPRLDELERRGRANGLSGLERLDGWQIDDRSRGWPASPGCGCGRPGWSTTRRSPTRWPAACAAPAAG